MNLNELTKAYREEGLAIDLAEARVCQDIVLTAISKGPLNRNVTIKGGVVMRSITKYNRRSTRDIDLDFIHYSLQDESIQLFVDKMNCIEGIDISILGNIEELKHQDYHGKSIKIQIKDIFGNSIISKVDIGVHKHFEIGQDEYCFDVCVEENGASLLKNTVEQTLTEKLRSLLILGSNSRRFKDIFDLYFLINVVDKEKVQNVIKTLVFDDETMRENDYESIYKRIDAVLKDKQFLRRASYSRQRWVDEDIKVVVTKILDWIAALKK